MSNSDDDDLTQGHLQAFLADGHPLHVNGAVPRLPDLDRIEGVQFHVREPLIDSVPGVDNLPREDEGVDLFETVDGDRSGDFDVFFDVE